MILLSHKRERTKKCSRCNEELELSEFHNYSASKDGLSYWCKECRRRSRKYGKDKIAADKEYKQKCEQELTEKNELAKDGLKRCSSCNEVKPYSDFGKTNKAGINGNCLGQCKKCLATYARNRNRKQKQQVMDYYGGQCTCCGENVLEFLTLHHVNGDGGAHRKELPQRHNAIIGWIIKNNYPSDFQVLCHNCHSALHSYGYCPHNKSMLQE